MPSGSSLSRASPPPPPPPRPCSLGGLVVENGGGTQEESGGQPGAQGMRYMRCGVARSRCSRVVPGRHESGPCQPAGTPPPPRSPRAAHRPPWAPPRVATLPGTPPHLLERPAHLGRPSPFPRCGRGRIARSFPRQIGRPSVERREARGVELRKEGTRTYYHYLLPTTTIAYYQGGWPACCLPLTTLLTTCEMKARGG